MDMDVRKAKQLFDHFQRERDMAQELKFSKRAIADGWEAPADDKQVAPFARMAAGLAIRRGLSTYVRSSWVDRPQLPLPVVPAPVPAPVADSDVGS